ncbi:hypothetical protein FGADI_12287 [Fusarium gaditjirri]|uniref:Uncharacterized protein n=1 Tax=Fusarium gaditjirri TaxID=282569 RepID=A0A8H4SSL9_9HYPO|nr:hypothetical protein FGADI_12287 [Fusarium gaditjirri]
MAPFGEVSAMEHTIMQTTTSSGLTVGIGNAVGSIGGTTVEREKKTSVVLTGYKSRKGNATGLLNVANWTIMEDPFMKQGIPPYVQTAILLERTTDEIFKADLNVNTDVSGFSFRNLQDGLLDSEDDPVIFDPSASPLIPDELAGVLLDDLGSVDVSGLWRVKNAVHIPDIPQRTTIAQAFKEFFSEKKTTEVKPVRYKVESWFVDLWNKGQVADSRPKLDRPLVRDDLNEYFSWISESVWHWASRTAMQSSVSELTSFDLLEGLFDNLPIKLLSDFFDPPLEYLIARQHDRGTCQVSNNQDDEKAFKVYIIQTPFYRTGFWSLLLYTMVDSNLAGGSMKLSGVIQADSDVKLTDIFSKVRKLVEKHGHHPTLLPYQLFLSHYEATKDGIDSIQKEIDEVDKKLLKHLKEEGKLDEASKLYRELSMTLHKSSMDLAELGRRRKFEEELGKFLQGDLKNDSTLKVFADIYLRMSQSRESDIESLPGKIESQRNVHDSYLQARLARESLRDSKAMKTLSILTILFLPGAFIATIFSTNMFDFKSKNQQVRIYFAIVIPLTAVLMIGWVLWLKNTPERADEESVRQNQPAIAMNWLKGSKAD